MEEKTCMVTGANRGIGKAIALGLAQRGAMVVMICRDSQLGEIAHTEIQVATGNQAVHLMLADLASLDAVRQLANEYQERYQQLNVLVNNAGVVKVQHTLMVDGYETTFAVNHLAPFLLTNLLLDALRDSAPSRIVNVSSLVQKWGEIDFDDLQREKHYGIDKANNQSKLANVLFTYELARRLHNKDVTVNSMEPGMTVTGFGRDYTGFKANMDKVWRPFMASPEKAAETTFYLAMSPELEGMSGKHFVKSRAVKSAKITYGGRLARQLWEVSELLTNITHPI